jgi:translocation and assembly module TamB
MRWRWVVIGVVLLALVGLPLLLGSQLLHSEQGLRFLLSQLDRIPDVQITVMGANGTLDGPITIDRLVVDHEAVHVEARDIHLQLNQQALWGGKVHLDAASATDVDVVLKTREAQPPSTPHFLPAFLEIVAPGVNLDHVALTLSNGTRLRVASIRGALAMTRSRISLTDLAIEDPDGRVDGNLTLRAALPLGLRGALNGRWTLPDGRTWRFAAAARGNLDRLGTTVTLASPLDLSFIGTALALTDEPHAVGTVRINEFDGSPWLDPGQLPQMSGSLSVDATEEAIGVDGTITSPALGAEQARVQAAGRLTARALEISSLRAWLPRSSADFTTAGTIGFGGKAPELELSGDWALLRWPINAEPMATSPSGTYRIEGPMPYSFEIQGEARVADMPEADLAARGTVDREKLVLTRLEGDAFKGRVSGSGRASWVGDQPWSARVDATNLDIASLRPDLPGQVSVVATIEGRGYSADAPWTAKLDALSGVLLGRAITGRGEISQRGGEYLFDGLRVASGSSNVTIDGRWGPDVDLRWNANLNNLSVLHPSLAGELVSSGTMRGTPERPVVVAEARGRKLELDGVVIESLTAQVDADLSNVRESHVDVRAQSISMDRFALEEARLRANGLARDHVAELEFRSAAPDTGKEPGVRATIEAVGGYDFAEEAWRGRLDQVTIRFPEDAASLLQPAAIELGAAGASADPICVSTDEARFCVEGKWTRDPGSWRVLYSAQDWPLRRLLHSLLGWREFDGRVQSSGWAEQQPGHGWVGGATVYIDDPVLDIPRNQFRTERVRLGSGRVDLLAVPDELRATVDMTVREGTRVEGEVRAHREPGREVGSLPLAGRLDVHAADLNGLPLLVPEIDRSGGTLDAELTVGGTLGDPRFTGEFHMRDGRIDMYRTNLSLGDFTLDGHFAGDELEFSGRGTAKRGDLAIDGHFSWPDGVMTGRMRMKGTDLTLADTPEYRIVASPDLVLTADAGGYDVTGDVKIPLARIRPTDLSSTVTSSPDERVVGAEAEQEGPSTLDRVHSRVRVELGDDVTVDSYGLKAKLAGAVTVITEPGDIPRGDGSIRVVEGEYKAFGQFVKIVRGVLSYKNSPLNEPTLDLAAEREIKAEDIVVSINVRGTLSNPFVTISSTPSMPEAEALSYLLMGRSINTLQSGEAASLNRAAESLAISGGGLLLGGIGTRIGLDEVAVEQDEEDATVVLGKYLSPKLFVSYGISIAEAINTVKLRYTLNERWALKAEAGLEQSADIEYKIER